MALVTAAAAGSELEAMLQSLQSLKAPGVTKSKVTSITTFCVENIKWESILAQKIYLHFKRTLATHKLGVLYVIDSVTRQWIERAASNGQELLGSAAPESTFASGVHKMTEFLPLLMNDLVQHAPEDQKEKILKMIDIWERGHVFPAEILADFKIKLNARTPHPSTQSATAAVSSKAAVLAPTEDNRQVSSNNHTNQDASYHRVVQQQPTQQIQQAPALVQPNVPPTSHASHEEPATNEILANITAEQAQALEAVIPPHIANDPTALAKHLELLQQLQSLGVPQEQWPVVIAALQEESPQQPQQQPLQQPQHRFQQHTQPQQPQQQPLQQPQHHFQQHTQPHQHFQHQQAQSQPLQASLSANDYATNAYAANDFATNAYAANDRAARSRNDNPYQYMQALGAEQSLQQHRNGSDQRVRSRSPPRRRGSPVYGEYKNPNVYRTRTPMRNSPSTQSDGAALKPKWLDFDASLKPGQIKVLSRTLFIGGTTLPEAELREIFARFGEVQTVITNPEKRQGFIKMSSRAGAVAAREGMEKLKDPAINAKIRSTRWGVGFGPRECSDFSTGISIISIDMLTEADHRWVLTAEYGGTGGKSLETGMVMEEPDIEIGAGVSSKAMSRRAADEPKIPASNFAPRGSAVTTRPPKRQEVQARPVHIEVPRRNNNPPQQYDPNGIGVAPAVPGFGFQLSFMPPSSTGMGDGMPPYA